MSRNPYFDALKWLLMMLVVYGHVILTFHTPDGSFSMGMRNAINLFHMPLFVFISGMFSQIKDRKRYLKGIVKLLECYLVFQIIQTLYFVLIAGESFSLLRFIVYPRFALWYILSLCCWRMMVYAVGGDVLKKYKGYVIAACFAISLLGGFIPIGRELSIQRTMAWLPLFMLGYYAKDVSVQGIVRKVPVWLAVTMVVVVISLFVFRLNTITWTSIFWECRPYSTPLMLVARAANMVGAAMMSIAVMRLVPASQRFAKWGGYIVYLPVAHGVNIHISNHSVRP